MKTKILTLILLAVTAAANAEIVATHPRVWIDSAKKTELQAKVSANTAEWQTLKTWCDANLQSTTGSYLTAGYHGLVWYNAIMNYGACFQATDDQTYGNEGVVYLEAMIDDGVENGTVGDGEGGVGSIDNDSFYVTRSVGAGVVIGRDWLDGATSLDTTLIDRIGAMVALWVPLVLDPGTWAIGNATSNYFYGHLLFIANAHYGLYGDTNYDAGWGVSAANLWNTYTVPALTTLLADGDWLEGWNYGKRASMGLLQYALSMETAGQDMSAWNDLDGWDKDLLKNALHGLYPSRAYMTDDARRYAGPGDILGFPNAAGPLLLLSTESPNLTTTEKGLAVWYDRNDITSSELKEWERFLWDDTSITAVTPTNANMGGLSWRAGNGHIMTRAAEWSNTDSTYLDIIAHTGGGSIANRNVGEVKMGTRGDLVLVDGDEFEQSGLPSAAYDLNSVPSISGSHTYAPNQEWWHDDVFTVLGESTNYSYIKVTGIENTFDGKYDNTPSADHYDRNILFIRPDITIVYDNINVVAAGTNAVVGRWFLNADPVIVGQTASVNQTNSDTLITVVSPSVSITSALSLGSRNNVYEMKADVDNDPEINQMLTVIEAMDSGGTPQTPTLITGDTGKGVLIGNTAAMFTSDSLGGDISSLAYTVSATTHYIADLPANVSVTVKRAGSEIATSPLNSGEAGIVEFTSVTGSAEYTIVVGTAVCDSSNPTLCTTQSACEGATLNWCDGACQIAECEVAPPPVADTHSVPWNYTTQ